MTGTINDAEYIKKPQLHIYVLYRLGSTPIGQTDRAVVLAENAHEARSIMQKTHPNEETRDDWLDSSATGISKITVQDNNPGLVMSVTRQVSLGRRLYKSSL
jgi:hypothetical protein